MSESLLDLSEDEFDKHLDGLGLLEPLKRGETDAIESYFNLFGAKLIPVKHKQPTIS